jgi:hypothetical protein
MYLNEELISKWGPVLKHENLPDIKNSTVRGITAVLLENTEKAINEDRAQRGLGPTQLLTEAGIPINVAGGISNYDPILISLVRRAMPNLIAYDICGVQPMTGPTGLIFALRSRYANQTGSEAFYNEPNTAFSTIVAGTNTMGQQMVGTLPGNSSVVSNLAGANLYNYAQGMNTSILESLGATGANAFPEMAFTIEKVTVTALSRALKAEYSLELAQDLKAIHGLDAETELSNILSTEILADINREIVRTVNITAKPGAQVNTTTAGVFDLDVDSNGRWSVERFKGLMFQLEREANQIAKDTRRGKGNIIICSSDVASALQMAGVLDYAPALNSNNLQVDDTGNTFVGVLNGRFRVYIDPYSAGGQYATIGYKGVSPFDAGLFYCPYVPLQMVRAVGEDSFQPRIGFKTRYGIVANPFAGGINQRLGALTADDNVYYRRVIIQNLM